MSHPSSYKLGQAARLTMVALALSAATLLNAIAQGSQTEPKKQETTIISSKVPASPRIGDVIRRTRAGLQLVWVPPGQFLMGSPETEEGRDERREGRQQTVTFDSGFWMGKYEITQDQWKTLMGPLPASLRFRHGRKPGSVCRRRQANSLYLVGPSGGIH